MTETLGVVTVGVYGFDGESFLRALRGAEVRLVLDVRQRRGVRGTAYAWANSLRLQAALARAGITYGHRPELAPTTELRRLQYAEDERQGVGKRSRRELAADYTRRFTTEVLDRADVSSVVSALPRDGVAALLCVERDPEACHRSLIARRLAEQHGVTIGHLRPPRQQPIATMAVDVVATALPPVHALPGCRRGRAAGRATPRSWGASW